MYYTIGILLSNLYLFRFYNVQGKIDCDEEGDIDESLNGMKQDDPVLIDAIKNYYLQSPASAKMPYNIDPDRLKPPKVYVRRVTIYLVVPKYLVSIISESKLFSSMFLDSFGSQIF